MVAWPSSLSKRQLISGYNESLPDTNLRSETDHGPAKIRRRFTAAPRSVSFTLLGTSTDVSVVDTFYITTINYGSQRFDMINPRTGSTDSYRFVSPPEYAPLSHNHWQISCSLEKMP